MRGHLGDSLIVSVVLLQSFDVSDELEEGFTGRERRVISDQWREGQRRRFQTSIECPLTTTVSGEGKNQE